MAQTIDALPPAGGLGDVAAMRAAGHSSDTGSFSEFGLARWARLERRTNLLAEAMRTVASAGDTVNIVCCRRHLDDLLVALVASSRLGCLPVLISPDEVMPRHDAANGLETASVTFACEEGTRSWQTAGGRGLLIGDGPYVRWWKVFELTGLKNGPEVRPNIDGCSLICR